MNQEQLDIEVYKRVGAVDEEFDAIMASISYGNRDEAVNFVDRLICEAQKLKITLQAKPD